MAHPYDNALDLIEKLRYDLTAAQTKLSELRRTLADVDGQQADPPRHPCPICGIQAKSALRLVEHLEIVHGKEPT